MSGALFLAVGSAVWMTFTCEPISDFAAQGGPLIVSFEQNGERIRRIVTINPVGSQDRRRWRGEFVGESYKLRYREECLIMSRTITPKAGSPERFTLNEYWGVSCGHTPMSRTENYVCEVQMAEVIEQ